MKTRRISLSKVIDSRTLSSEEKIQLKETAKYIGSIFINDELIVNIDIPASKRKNFVKLPMSEVMGVQS